MFSVRKATLADADSILRITRQAFLKYIELANIPDTAALHETKEQVEYDIMHKYVYVAYIDDEVVGSVRAEQVNEATAYLSRFGVSDAYQNLGIGKSIMGVFDKEMKKMGIKKVVLHTAAKAFPLMRFYYGRGFYVHSTTHCKGYIRALLCKDYE
ncbi:MAG: GNAT family N-acetyltransferase [Ruminococcaceae bacterium]|nr:GNAT family N-acetyltransferase [Oscillospiraceae bacterium]